MTPSFSTPMPIECVEDLIEILDGIRGNIEPRSLGWAVLVIDRASAELRAVAAAETAAAPVEPTCQRPPPGWTCSRRHQHQGPCAARPVVYPGPKETV
jgi:hypothetical protein